MYYYINSYILTYSNKNLYTLINLCTQIYVYSDVSIYRLICKCRGSHINLYI